MKGFNLWMEYAQIVLVIAWNVQMESVAYVRRVISPRTASVLWNANYPAILVLITSQKYVDLATKEMSWIQQQIIAW